MLDLRGLRFGNLIVLENAEPIRDSCSHYSWKCKCDCGNELYIPSRSLVNHRTTSCGCYRRKTSSENLKKYWDTISVT